MKQLEWQENNPAKTLLNLQNKPSGGPVKDVALSKYVIFVCVTTTIGSSMPTGYHLSVINAPAENMKIWCNETISRNYGIYLGVNELQWLWASIVSIFLVGGVISSTCGAQLADKFGRKFAHLAGSILFIIGALFCFYCRIWSSVLLLMFGRLFIGLASGITTSTNSMYLTEIAPSQFRGPVGTLLSTGMVSGIILGEILSLDEVLGDKNWWHYALSAYIILVIIGLIPYYWYPESPKYLYIVADQKESAWNELKRLRNNNLKLIEEEIIIMENELCSESTKRSLWSVIVDPALLLPVCLVSALQAGLNLSGGNAVVYYSVSMMESININSSLAKWFNLGIGLIQFIVACLAVAINAHYNRRSVVLISVIGSGVFLSILVILSIFLEIAHWLAYGNVIAILCFMIVFEIGLGPIPFFIATELFESGVRPAAVAFGSVISWLSNIFVGFTFPILQIIWGYYVFIPCALSCFMLAIFLYIYLPETKGIETSVVAALVKDGFRSRPLVYETRL